MKRRFVSLGAQVARVNCLDLGFFCARGNGEKEYTERWETRREWLEVCEDSEIVLRAATPVAAYLDCRTSEEGAGSKTR